MWGLAPILWRRCRPRSQPDAARGMPAGVLQQFMAVQPTVGFASIAACAKRIAGLLQRGYAVEAIQQIIGGNWLRLYGAVW